MGCELSKRDTRNVVVLFNTDHTAAATTTSASYVVTQTADADHVIYDMAGSSNGYSVSVSASADGALLVTVSQGGPFALTARGTLAFSVSLSGAVTPSFPLGPG